jgi:prepilin-type N-terminal cleavage/methylation domain-containing protein
LKHAAGQQGFSFIEIMVAVLLLAICALPMGDAIRNGISASSLAAAKSRELRCIKNTMETVLAQPYQNLWNAARNQGETTVLPLPADTACAAPPRLFIVKYEYDAGLKKLVKLSATASPERLESPLLYVSVAAANDGGYALTTLVAR